MPLESNVLVVTDSKGRKKRMRVLSNAIIVVLGHLQKWKLERFLVQTGAGGVKGFARTSVELLLYPLSQGYVSGSLRQCGLEALF